MSRVPRSPMSPHSPKKAMRSPLRPPRSPSCVSTSPSKVNAESLDRSLRNALPSSKYDELRYSISNGVPEFYKQKMLPVCDVFLDNARKIGKVHVREATSVSSSPRKQKMQETEQVNDGSWRKDPRFMSDEELFEETLWLSQAIKYQRKANDQARTELQILDPAMRRYDLEKQCVYLELFEEETGILSPKK